MDPSASAAAKEWQRSASEDLWQRTLSQIPTQFGRLVYLSRLHNPELGCYEHYGLAAVFGQERAEQALRESHEAVMSQWLAYPLAQQIEDLSSYLNSLQQSRKRLLATWLKSRSYALFLPGSASPAQRGLYEANLELILVHLKDGNAFGE